MTKKNYCPFSRKSIKFGLSLKKFVSVHQIQWTDVNKQKEWKNMPQKNYNNVQGVRSDRYSGSKLTNWEDFDPADTAVEQIYYKYLSIFEKAKTVKIIEEKLHPKFIMPISEEDIRYWLRKLPQEFIQGLKAILLLSGSNKIEKTFFSRLYSYGMYWNNCIFIIPFPKRNTNLIFNRPKPHIINDYARVGATIDRDDEKGIKIYWTKENLRQFYLRDVFIHEIGHHYDKRFNQSKKMSEGFAEWFATEFGIKLKKYENE